MVYLFESGVKHLTSNGQMMDQTFVYVVHNIKKPLGHNVRAIWVVVNSTTIRPRRLKFS
jgi:hypothetical protein